MTEPKHERNLQICQLYMSGMTLQECGTRFKVSRQRVKQILHKYGAIRRRRVVTPKTFLGVGVPPALKAAIQDEADAQQRSVSALVSDFIEEALKEDNG